ncbi:hypothetical protein NDU88_008293 [Pleurodeles waltl]|uniref:Uncharacterized protein n=1 Tax=Pleurodeles waltl TaxID=8319 RepID=A0AAV7U2L4_PLEWA|nr:hypothetical protein NDU88_008293 [Pleurodeles waltl]
MANTIDIPANARHALTQHLLAHGLTEEGGDVTLIIEATEAYQTETLYCWVTFPEADQPMHTFHTYEIANVPVRYEAYQYHEISLTYQEHQNWFEGALPHVLRRVRLGPLSNEGPTWPMFATYTPHPGIQNMPIADLQVLYNELVALYRRLVQFVMRTLNTTPARPTPPVAGGYQLATGINPQTVHTIMGKVPTEREKILFWIAQKTNQLEAVFPHTGPQEKHRLLTMCLPFGMVPSVDECATWGTVFAAVYTTIHGTPTLANLPEVLKQIQNEHGAAPALDLGMKLMRNFDAVSSIILSNIKGEAVALAIRQRLRETPNMEQERQLPKIISDTYTSIGRDSLGAKPKKLELPSTTHKEGTKQAQEGSKKRWDKEKDLKDRRNKRADSPHPEYSERRYHLRNREDIRTPDRYTDSRPSRSFQDAPDKRSERGGRQDRRPEYVKEKKDSPQSTIKKEEKTPQQKPQFKKKKVAALTVKNASGIENTVEEQEVGRDSVGQCGRGHDMSPESERSSRCDSD